LIGHTIRFELKWILRPADAELPLQFIFAALLALSTGHRVVATGAFPLQQRGPVRQIAHER